MIKLVTDSSADLPIELLQKYDITVVPMNVSIEGKDFREGVDLTPQEFFKKMFASAELPKTSQPSPLLLQKHILSFKLIQRFFV